MCVIMPKCGPGDPDCKSLAGVQIFVDTFYYMKENVHDTFANCQHEVSQKGDGVHPMITDQSLTSCFYGSLTCCSLKERELTAGFQGGTKAEDKEVQRNDFIR